LCRDSDIFIYYFVKLCSTRKISRCHNLNRPKMEHPHLTNFRQSKQIIMFYQKKSKSTITRVEQILIYGHACYSKSGLDFSWLLYSWCYTCLGEMTWASLVPILWQLRETLIRPKLEYCCTVWDPHTNENINSLEKVQRRAARYTCNRHHNTRVFHFRSVEIVTPRYFACWTDFNIWPCML
jgi:hypothetical protein